MENDRLLNYNQLGRRIMQQCIVQRAAMSMFTEQLSQKL